MAVITTSSKKLNSFNKKDKYNSHKLNGLAYLVTKRMVQLDAPHSTTYVLLEVIPSFDESFVCGDGGLIVVPLERLEERLLQLLHVAGEGHERADGQPDQEQQGQKKILEKKNKKKPTILFKYSSFKTFK